MLKWDTQKYLKFINERTQPAMDLASRVCIESPQSIVDIGCGPGNSTSILRERWAQAEICAFDSSKEMIDNARQGDQSVEWFEADASTWEPKSKFDLIFSNAALQWVSEHEIVFPRLMSYLNEKGVLAIQMPAHYDSPLHCLMIEASNRSEWAGLMSAARNALKMEPPSFYYDLLSPYVSKLDIWQTEYFHELESVVSILEWFRSTGMRPFLESLQTVEEKTKFESELLKAYTRAYKVQKNGKVLLPFRRFFITAYR